MENLEKSSIMESLPDSDGVSSDPTESLYDFDLNIFLRTCNKETENGIKGETTFGKIPGWLNGSLIRNGPGGVDKYGKGKLTHFLDAPGLLQKYQLENGELTYTCRFIQGKSYKQNLAAQRLVLSEFGTVGTPDPCQTIVSRISSLFVSPIETILSDNANIGIIPFGDEAYSLAEAPFAHRINLKNLETLETINVHNELGLIHHTAHPHIWNKKYYNLGSKLGFPLRPCYVVAELDYNAKTPNIPQNKAFKNPFDQPTSKSPWSTAKIVATIPSRWPLRLGYMHSFATTQNYFIIIEQPLSIWMPKFAVDQLMTRNPLVSSLQFFPEEDTYFYVVSRNQAHPQSRVFRVPAFFYFHTINGFETKDGEDDIIVVDICCYDDASAIDSMYVAALENAKTNPDYAKMLHGRPKRFILKTANGQVAESQMIVNIGCEMPKINVEFNGMPYNYFYAICSDVADENPGQLIKVDVVNNTFKTWNEPNAFASEPIFVPAPNSKGEDDGIIMSIILYSGESRAGPNRSTLVILNARSFDTIAKVDIFSESAIPKCFHGWFFPDNFDTEKKTTEDTDITFEIHETT